MSKKIVMLLAEGFEEIEAVATADVLARLGFDIWLTGVDGETVNGAHGINIKTDCLLGDTQIEDFDAVVLPGGMPGSTNLRDNHRVVDFVQNAYVADKIIGAICAAPIVLKRAGIIEGKRVTCYPGFESQLTGAICTGARTETDSRIVTAKGAGVSFEFGAAIALVLGAKKNQVEQLFKAMIID